MAQNGKNGQISDIILISRNFLFQVELPQFWKPVVEVQLMQLLSWFLEEITLVLKLTFGLWVFCYMLCFVDFCHLMMKTLAVCIEKFKWGFMKNLFG